VQQSVQIVNATVDALLASYQGASAQLQGRLDGRALTWPLDTVGARLASLKDVLLQELGGMGDAFPGACVMGSLAEGRPACPAVVCWRGCIARHTPRSELGPVCLCCLYLLP
jgi:hypothetical protein